MTCRDVRQRLADDPQAAKQDPKIAEHLAACPACRDLLERLEAVEAALGDLGEMAPPDQVVHRTLERVEAEKPRRRRTLRLVMALGTASVVLVLLATGLVGGMNKMPEMFATSANALAGNEEVQTVDDRHVRFITPTDGERAAAGRYHLGPAVPVSGKEGSEASGETYDQGGLGEKRGDGDGWGDGLYGHKGMIANSDLGDTYQYTDDEGLKASASPKEPEVPEVSLDEPDSTVLKETDRKSLEQRAEHYWRQGDLAKAGQLRAQLDPRDRLASEYAPTEQPPADEPAQDLPDSNSTLVQNQAQLARSARLVPHLRDGKVTGFKVYGVRPGSDMDKLGIRNGDVIQTIDGKDLTSPDKALSAYQSVADKDTLELGIERRGERFRISGRVSKLDRDLSEAYVKDVEFEKNMRWKAEEGRKLNHELSKQPQHDTPPRTVAEKVVVDEVALVADPEPKPDPVDGSRRVSGDAKGREAYGTLVIDAVPPGAKVVLDGQAVATTPINGVQVSPGRHRVELERQGYRTQTFEVQVQGGERLNLRVPVGSDARIARNLVQLAQATLDGEEIPPERLSFIPASGYFRNTYLPGDPRRAWLRERLQTGLYLDGERLALERAAAAYLQPFDPPASDGLAVYLTADRASLEGPARMTLQVGLKGSTRHAARRAALNAVLVVDLRGMPSEQARRTLWSLADAMSGAVQAGDRFWLVTVGADVAVKVTPGRFEPTTVRRALAQALLGLESREPDAGGLRQGLERAYSLLAGPAGDQAAPLGSNLVLLASAGPLGEPAADLAGLAHRWALAGVTTSTLGVVGQADGPSLGELALAGQGRRRLVAAAGEAERVIADELAACGSVVARAVRLRIRLADGVRLVGVLGSQPLSAPSAQRVRQAEQAIDQRVSSSLGIEADRGEDEEGIQIVIPAFYAGDDHVILLDVLAPGPGPLADVQVRYKDLVKLDNAVARVRLSLPNGQRPSDPRNWNVSKNLLAHQLSEDLALAAQSLAQGRPAEARRALAVAAVRIQRFVERAPQHADDPELARDRTMLAGYLKVLGDLPAWQGAPAVREHLAHSLELAALAKRAHWGDE